ncbi:crossover junction endodeoxyribonuclease RuvC [Candidatus Sumerlaeota bacterium]|nr:crossover junction endodeoxyribonuclease RuvC [Candidatus Sumerlaeota bacterium]
MIILGIDPGLAKTGCGVVTMRANQPKVLTYGVISTKTDQSLANRLKIIYNDIRNLCREYKPSVAAIESIFFAANVKTAVAVAQARGVAILATEESGMELAEYSPLQIKQAIVGYGRASKNQIQEMVRILLSLDKTPRPDHAADALAVALTHAFRMKLRGGYRAS